MAKYEKQKEKGSWKKKLLIALCVFLAVVLVLLVALCIAAESILGELGNLDATQNTYSNEEMASILEQSEAETDPVVEQAESIFKGKNVVNILLVGQDRREGQPRQRSDAMILCTINKETKTLTMTSFMRDIWVYIPDHYNQRINVPYMLGGHELLNETLEYNFGVSADYNIEIDFGGFMKAVDVVGGVEIELTAAEARYLNRRGNWEVEENTNWNLKEGVNNLTGSQALAFSRIREIGADFERTNRQRMVLTSLLEKAKSLSLSEVQALVKEVLPLVATDMTSGEIMSVAGDMMFMLSDLKIISQRIPMDNEYSFANKNGASVIVLSKKNLEANKALLADAMKEDEE